MLHCAPILQDVLGLGTARVAFCANAASNGNDAASAPSDGGSSDSQAETAGSGTGASANSGVDGGDSNNALAAPVTQQNQQQLPPQQQKKKKKEYQPLRAPPQFAGLDAMSSQIFQPLQQQDRGAQIVISKQMTPLLAIVHDFNIGIDQYIPEKLRASIYTFRAMLTNFTKTNTLSAQVDWFGRLNASFQRKWSNSATSTLVAHISNSNQGVSHTFCGCCLPFVVLLCRPHSSHGGISAAQYSYH